ncbi:MAG: glycogen/starch synthase [Bacteroidales bacterium]|nr:glycogen/starch synthase [Bacteroidales bacterium]
MGKGKILYVNQEITPFTSDTPNAHFGQFLPAAAQQAGREIRIFMPRFSTINERRNQLHEVIRLSGMNLIVNNCDHQLIIKVGTVPTGRMQVYFIDNEEYFVKRGGLFDGRGRFVKDNDERTLFFCRGVLEAVRKLAWQPHVIHFTGWFTCMIPFYLRRINKENAFFNGTRTVFTLTNDKFKGNFGDELERKLKADGATAKDLRMYQDLDWKRLMMAAITYAHGVVIADPEVDKELIDFAKDTKKNVLDYCPDEAEFFAQINQFYDIVAGPAINHD